MGSQERTPCGDTAKYRLQKNVSPIPAAPATTPLFLKCVCGRQRTALPRPDMLLLALLQPLASLCLLVAHTGRLWEADPPQRASRSRRVYGGRRRHRPPPPPPQASRQVQLVAGVLLTVAKLLGMALKTDISRAKHPLNALSLLASYLLVLVPLVILPALAPPWFERNRRPLFATAFAAYFMLGTVRDPRGILQVLQASPLSAGGCRQRACLQCAPGQPAEAGIPCRTQGRGAAMGGSGGGCCTAASLARLMHASRACGGHVPQGHG